MVAIERKKSINQKPVTTYREKKIGKTLYRVKSVYLGEIELKKALEDLTVRKILQNESVSMQCQC